jgi:catechol 2,3-dioxygenase-like lactoylglutathione lyase family enzyme
MESSAPLPARPCNGSLRRVFDHVAISVSDLAAFERFFRVRDPQASRRFYTSPNGDSLNGSSAFGQERPV